MKLTEIISLPRVYDAATDLPLFSADVFADLMREEIACAVESAFDLLNASSVYFTAIDNTNHNFTLLDAISVRPCDAEEYADKLIDLLIFSFDIEAFPREIEMTAEYQF